MNAKSFFKKTSSLNRFFARRQAQAEKLGKRAISAVRWERGMLTLKAIHAEIALKATTNS